MPPNYQPPQYNLLCNAWLITATIKPANGAADITDLACQKYISSRNLWDLTPPWTAGFYLEWHPPVMIRLPRVSPFDGPWQDWEVSCIECPAGSGQYYRAFWADVQHEGFINEYVMWCGVQCDEDLKSVPPAGGSQPTGVGADAGGFIPPASPPTTTLPPSSFPPGPSPAAAFLDTFADTGTTVLESHTANSGETWTVGVGSAEIVGSGNGVIAVTGSGGECFYTANFAGPLNASMIMQFTTPSDISNGFWIASIYRAQDENNWFAARVEYDGVSDYNLSFYKCTAGTPALEQLGATTFSMSTNTQYELQLQFSGPVVQAMLSQSGSTIAIEAYNNSLWQFNTQVGLWWTITGTDTPVTVDALAT